MSRMLFVTGLAADASLSKIAAELLNVAKTLSSEPVLFQAVPEPAVLKNFAAQGKVAEYIDTVLGSCCDAMQNADLVICQGLDAEQRGETFAQAMNISLAASLGIPVLLAINGDGRTVDSVAADIAAFRQNLAEQCLQLSGVYLIGMDEYCEALSKQLNLLVAANAQDFAGVLKECESHITPRLFEFGLIEKARRHQMRIVLPEGEEDRLIQAAAILLQRKVAKIILLGNPEKILERASALHLNISDATIINPSDSPDFGSFASTYAELRAKKGVTLEQAREKMLDPTYYGTMMIHKGMADGMVSGAINTTAHTVRPALEFIKTKPGASIVSSAFFVCLKDRVNTYGDCAINLDPSSEQLADIAITTAETARAFGLEPRVALLSYSTGNSGKGPSVDKVREAARIAKEKKPDMLITGPIQYDAAVDPTTAKTKLPGDPVAGRASVFIVPDINTGNNLYKAVQRSAHAIAIGPVLQGLRKPVNDLSRGCTVPDIVNTVAITAIQAQAENGLA